MPSEMMLRAVVAGAVSLAVLAGCTDKQPEAPPASSAVPTPSATPTVDPTVAGATDSVLDRYRRFRTSYTNAGYTADYKNKELTGYLETPLKQQVVAYLLQMYQKGMVYRGEPESNPTVTTIDLKAKKQTAVVEDCFDGTDYRVYYKSSKTPLPIKSGSRRYILQTTATNFGASRGWLFTSAKSFPERTC